MADAKISALTALTSADNADLVPLVDVSDTTMAASGTTKRITLANLLTSLAANGLLTTAAAPELIRDTMGTALVAGSNVTITVNDGADTITIAATGGGGGASALDDLSDVTITSAATGNVLRYNGTAWVNVAGSTFFEAAGAVAAHEADTTSVHGIADTSALLTTSSGIDALSDVTITAAASGDILRHNGTAWVDAVGTAHFEAAGAVSTHAALTSSVHGISTFGASLVDDADASAARTTLGLGSLATLSAVTSSQITDGTIVNGDISASAAIDLSKLATDPLARANHTGTQTASTISDFAEVARDTIGTALVAGSNITITVNDPADTITIASTGGSSTANYKYRSATQYHNPEGLNPTSAASQSAATASTLTFWPFYVAGTATVAGLAAWCYTLEAGSLLRLGIYTSSSNLVPTTLIVDYGTVSGATTGAKEVTGSTSIGPGWVFLAAATSTHTTVRWGRNTSTPLGAPLGIQNQFGRAWLGWVATGTDHTAGLPSSAPTVSLFDHVGGAQYVNPIVRLS